MTRRALLAVLISLVVTASLLHPLCNLLFACGCDVYGPAHCNVHAALSPRCPWCAHPTSFGLAGLAGLLGGTIALWSLRRRPLALQVLGLVVVGLLLASVSGYGAARYYHYPTFLGTTVP